MHGSAQPLFQKLVDQRGASRPSDQDNLVNLGSLQPGVSQALVETMQSLHQERANHLLVLGADDLHVQVQGHVFLGGDEFFLEKRAATASNDSRFFASSTAWSNRTFAGGDWRRSIACFLLKELHTRSSRS